MASAWSKDRTNARGQVRSTVYFRDPKTGEQICDGTYTSKIGKARVGLLLLTIDDPAFITPKLGRQPFKVYVERWFAQGGKAFATTEVRSYLDDQLLPAFGEVPLKDIDRFLVQEWINRLVNSHDPDNGPDSAESIHGYYSVLSTIMTHSACDNYIPFSRIGKGTVSAAR